jgi:hypothetical protein
MNTTTITRCNATHTSLGELFIVSVNPSYEHRQMFDVVIEGSGRNSVLITGTKEDLMKIAQSLNRAISQI